MPPQRPHSSQAGPEQQEQHNPQEQGGRPQLRIAVPEDSRPLRTHPPQSHSDSAETDEYSDPETHLRRFLPQRRNYPPTNSPSSVTSEEFLDRQPAPRTQTSSSPHVDRSAQTRHPVQTERQPQGRGPRLGIFREDNLVSSSSLSQSNGHRASNGNPLPNSFNPVPNSHPSAAWPATPRDYLFISPSRSAPRPPHPRDRRPVGTSYLASLRTQQIDGSHGSGFDTEAVPRGTFDIPLRCQHPGSFNMTSSTPTPERHPFDRKVDETKISKSDVNNFIMDYLITEGYPSAARKFALEANIQPKADFEAINERVQIRNSIHKGDLQTAIELINELNPELLDTNTTLHFSLLRLQLIELIRKIPNTPDTTAVEAALDFASTHLAPRAPTNPQFINDLERTMALLIFRPETWAQQQQNQAPAATGTTVTANMNGTSQISASTAPNPTQSPFGALSELVDPSLRKKVAKDVNAAILLSQGQKPEARLRQLVRTRAWAEKLAREKKIDLPAKLELGLDGEEAATTRNGHAEGQGQNGHARDTVMAENGTSGSGGGRARGTADGDAVLAQFTNIP